MRQLFSIGELAKATQTKIETIRYYERIELLPQPGRTSGNYRSYSEHHLGRLSFVRRARGLGFSIEQVKALLDLSDQRSRSCAKVDAMAKMHLQEVDKKLSDLKRLRRELNALIKQCHQGTIADCRIIEALGPQ